jgi:Leucine-rich repeat (LRR) protein
MRKLLYALVLFWGGIAWGMEEEIILHTNTGEPVTLVPLITSPDILSQIEEKSAQLDRKFNQKAWYVLTDLFLLTQILEENSEAEISLKENNPLITHKLSSRQGDEVLDLFALIILPRQILAQALQAYIEFKTNKTGYEFEQFEGSLKTKLDKYKYLCQGEHLTLPAALLAYVSLKELTLYDTPLDDERVVAPSLDLSSLSLQRLQGWKKFYENYQIDSQAITTLKLSNNGLISLKPTLLKNFSNLTQLDLENNKLEALPEELLHHCPKLIILDLSHNRLRSIPEGFLAHCPRLTFLNLRDNSLESIPANLLDACTELHHIYLNSNPLTSLDLILFENKPHLETKSYDPLPIQEALVQQPSPPRFYYQERTVQRNLFTLRVGLYTAQIVMLGIELLTDPQGLLTCAAGYAAYSVAKKATDYTSDKVNEGLKGFLRRW